MFSLRKYILPLGMLFLSLFSFAQKENNVWYFGENAGLDFNSGSPVSITNGALNNTEACGSISDANGNLLFYTDGIQVWDKTHTLMPNGTGLLGDASSSQLCIVPLPGSTSQYYIFTVDKQGGSNGFCYSIVDMALNGGLGDITSTKNIQLIGTVSEKVVAIKHKNNVDFWIVTHEWDSDAFYAYLLSCNGLSLTPIITHIGTVHTGGNMAKNGYAVGCMKANMQKNKLALALRAVNGYEVFDFDNSSGALSNLVSIANNYSFSYGVEFSPDGSKLYGACTGGTIYQFDLNAGSATAIISSATLIATSSKTVSNTIQLGPDNKIYCGRDGDTYLDVIDNPNASGTACNFIDKAIDLLGKTCRLGLPNLIQNIFFETDTFHFLRSDTCFGNATSFIFTDSSSIDSLIWNFGDANSGSLNSSTNYTSQHIYTTIGKFKITLTLYKSCLSFDVTDSIEILASPKVNIGNDTTICTGNSLTLNADNIGSIYNWNTNETSQTIIVNTSGTFWVTVDNGTCQASDSINMQFTNAAFVNLGNDTSICENQLLVIDAENIGSTYNWSNNENTQSIAVNTSGKYWVEVINSDNCKASDTINISIIELPTVQLGNDTSFCLDETLTLVSNSSNTSSFIWNNGETSNTIEIKDEGDYWIEASNSCETVRDSIHIDAQDCHCNIYIPNTFSPNHDQINDVFKIEYTCDSSYFSIQIFNRWGNTIFKSNDLRVAWDGTKNGVNCLEDTYVYFVSYKNEGSKMVSITGKISLIR